MDILSDLLDTLRLRAGKGYNVVLNAPWGIEFPARENGSPFYVVSRGAGRLELTNPVCGRVLERGGHGHASTRGRAYFARRS